MPLRKPSIRITSPDQVGSEIANLTISHWFDASLDSHFSGSTLRDRRDTPVASGAATLAYLQRVDNSSWPKGVIKGLKTAAFTANSNGVAELKDPSTLSATTLPASPLLLFSVVQCSLAGTFFSQSVSATAASRLLQVYRNTTLPVGQTTTSAIWRGVTHDIYEDASGDPANPFVLTAGLNPSASKIALSAGGRFVNFANAGSASETARFAVGGRPNGTLGTYSGGLLTGHLAELVVFSGSGVTDLQENAGVLQRLKNFFITKWGLPEATYKTIASASCQDATATSIVEGWVAGTRVLTRQSSDLYTYGDETLERVNSSSAWAFKNLGSTIVTSLTPGAYPWLAIWPSPYSVSKSCQ